MSYRLDTPHLVKSFTRKMEDGRYVATHVLSNGARIRGRNRDKAKAQAQLNDNLDAYLDLYYSKPRASAE
jgi:hypothetical protein